MARTPDELLARLRAAARHDQRHWAELFTELDQLLSAGGPLPSGWVPAAEREITDLMLPGDTAPGGRHRKQPAA